jgi:hypothetical protein
VSSILCTPLLDQGSLTKFKAPSFLEILYYCL